MDFVPQPDEAKKFMSMKWIKWHIYKYPNIFIMGCLVPPLIYKIIEVKVRYTRMLNEGKFVPNVIMNKYAVCRPDDWKVVNTPKRYVN